MKIQLVMLFFIGILFQKPTLSSQSTLYRNVLIISSYRTDITLDSQVKIHLS